MRTREMLRYSMTPAGYVELLGLSLQYGPAVLVYIDIILNLFFFFCFFCLFFCFAAQPQEDKTVVKMLRVFHNLCLKTLCTLPYALKKYYALPK